MLKDGQISGIAVHSQMCLHNQSAAMLSYFIGRLSMQLECISTVVDEDAS